jgi:hypothetical protein
VPPHVQQQHVVADDAQHLGRSTAPEPARRLELLRGDELAPAAVLCDQDEAGPRPAFPLIEVAPVFVQLDPLERLPQDARRRPPLDPVAVGPAEARQRVELVVVLVVEHEVHVRHDADPPRGRGRDDDVRRHLPDDLDGSLPDFPHCSQSSHGPQVYVRFSRRFCSSAACKIAATVGSRRRRLNRWAQGEGMRL